MTKVMVNGVARDMTAKEQAEYDARNKSFEDNKAQRQLEKIRNLRLKKLEETDWWVLRGEMTDEQKAWRKSLRDLPQDYDETQYDELLALDEQDNLTHTIWEKP